MIKWTKKEAREFMVKYHMINTNDDLQGKEGIHLVFDRLQSIQVDPLDVVGRNVDLVLQARVKNYKKYDINNLLYKDRTIVDGWDKMMCIYPTKDFPYFATVRKHRAASEINTLEHRLQINALDYLDEVLELIKESPKYSKEISLGGKKKHYWGQTKVSSAALDYLYLRGDILVRDRNNQHRQFDLTENLIGDMAHSPSPFKSDDEFIEYYLLRRIKACGLFSNKSGVHSSGTFIGKKNIRTKCIEILLQKELIEDVSIEGINEVLYIPKNAQLLSNSIKDKISFIAPLDNLIWDRNLVELLFDFHYRWEVYTPLKKREYGYYVLPILYKSEFIGRIEFEKHRGIEDLKIKNIWFEPNVRKTKKLDNKIGVALRKFQHYLK